MLQHVWERAGRARTLSRLVIATDDEQDSSARPAASEPGAHDPRPTIPRARTVWPRWRPATRAEVIVNIQGDEPLIDPDAIDAAVNGLLRSAELHHGHAEEAYRGSGRALEPERGQGGDGPGRQRHLLLPVADPLRSRRTGRSTTSTSGCTSTAGIFCSATPACRWGRSKRPRSWSNCGLWRTATRSGSWKPNTSLWAWTRPRI